MRWLAHRGGALDFREHGIANRGQPYPVAVALGADPATILGAVTPVPDSLSEYQFAGLLRGSRTELVKAIGSELRVPASAEIVLEGHIYPDQNHPSGYEHALEGPYGDHTGYYNEQDMFPGVHDRPHHHAARPDLPLDLHRQAARRAGHAGRGAERSVHAAAAKAVHARSPTSTCRRKAAATAWPWCR